MLIELRCGACGGTTSLILKEGEKIGVEECCCGVILLASNDPPSVLGLSVADGIALGDGLKG